MRPLPLYILPTLLIAAAIACPFIKSTGRSRAHASPDAPITLRVANWGGPAVDQSFMNVEREILDQFHRKNPTVRVQIENIPGPGQYVPKLLMTFVAGNPPDVVTLDASSAAVFITNNLLADLTPLIQADNQFTLDDFFPNVLDIARRDNKLFAIPLDFTPMVILYNRKLFRDANVPYPKPGWTRAEFLDAALKLTRRTPRQSTPACYGFNFQKEMPLWFPWIWAAGSDVLSPDARHAVGYLDSPKTIQTIQFLIDLIKKHNVAPSLSQSAAAGIDLFRVNKAAMTMTGHWSLIEYRLDKLDIGVASIPIENQNSKKKPVTVIYEAGLAISKNSPHKHAAWQYIKHMTSQSVQKKRVATGIAISANIHAARSFAGNPIEDAFLEQVQFARPPWGSRCERYELVEDLGREMIEDILNGNVPVNAAAARTARLIEQQLTRER